MRRDLFSIGEFSRMSRISIKALRHYDQEGILRAAHVDGQSGYRYYSSTQLPEANLVRMLRSLEMPLPDMRAFLREKDLAKREAMLDEHRERIRRRIAEYTYIISSIERLIEGKEKAMEREVVTRDVAEQPALGVRFQTSMMTMGEDFGKAFGTLFGFLGRTGMQPVGPPMTLYLDPEFTEDKINAEVCVPIEKPVPGGGGVESVTLSGGKFASTLHFGPYHEIGEAYQALTVWLRENALEPAGPFRETYLVGVGQVEDPAEYRTEVSCPIA